MTREEILAYAAGIMDGEGCIMISRSNSPNTRTGKRHMLLVEVSNTEPRMLWWMKEQFGGFVNLKNSNRIRPTWKPCWAWNLRGGKAAQFLSSIAPYLQIKMPQAKLALEFYKDRGKGKPLGREGSVLQQAQYILMRELNKKGVREEVEA